MGNTITRLSKLSRATFMAALTTPLVLSLALLSYYKNRHIKQLLPRNSKSVRFNDTVTKHEVETVEILDTSPSEECLSVPVPVLESSVLDETKVCAEGKIQVPNTEASVLLMSSLEVDAETLSTVIDVEEEGRVCPADQPVVLKEVQEGPHTWNIRDTAELLKMKENHSPLDSTAYQLVQQRQEKVLERLAALSKRIEVLESGNLTPNNLQVVNYTRSIVSEVEQRVMDVCRQIGLTSAKMFRVPSDYYSWNLEDRRAILNAPSVDHLCKSIIVENTQCIYSDCSHPENSRFYCVILQYTARFQSHKLFKFVRTLVTDAPKKNYHFAYAKEEDSLRLTGFEHNAITPIGTTTKLPVILSHKIAQLSPKFYFLGGGEVELKLCVDVEEFVRTVKPWVVDVTID